jgi:predicted TPR repeat methyltransferase
LFVFSCEATVEGEPDLVLRKSLRYAHSEDSVRAACEAAGFKKIDIEAFDIRNEHGTPVAGFIVCAST